MASWQVPNRPIRPSLPNWGKCISLSVSKRLPEKPKRSCGPVISLALPTEGLKVLPGVEYTFTPDIQHSDQEDFRCRWLCAGEVVSTQMSYTFREEAVGRYPIRI